MRAIKKVSEINYNDVADYLNIYELDKDEIDLIKTLLEVAKAYISSYTGQDNLDLYPDYVIVIFVLCQDMYDNRTMYVDKDNVSKVVQTILDMHSINLL